MAGKWRSWAAGSMCLLLAACGGATQPASPGAAAGTNASTTGNSIPAAPGTGTQEQAATGGTPAEPTPPPPSPSPKELPGGGRTIFPERRLVGYAGAPGSEAYGRLGIGDLDERAAEMVKRAQPYGRDRRVLPVLELIATVATKAPGTDGMYRTRSDDETIARYLAAARKVDGVLLLGIQPGRADFLPEVKAYEKWLREPDVGLALDPEWAVDDGEVPGRTYGNTTGAELNGVASYLSELVAANNLPEKPLIFHQVAPSIVRDLEALRPHPGVAPVKSVDGIGGKQLKEATWRVLTRDLPPHIASGFKLFYEEDVERGGRLMTPDEVLKLRPQPGYVLYE